MRIRQGRSLASLFLASCNNGGNDRNEEDPEFLEQQLIGGTVAAASSITPVAASCQVNRSPWDVSPIVLAFFHLDQTAAVLQEDQNEVIRSSDTLSPSTIRTETKGSGDSPRDFAVCSTSHGPRPISSSPLPEKDKRLSVQVRTKKRGRKDSCWANRKGAGSCKRKDGKGWTCGAPAKSGSSFCHHHLSQLRSYCSKKAGNGRNSKEPQFPFPKAEDASESRYCYDMGFASERNQTKRNNGVPSEWISGDVFTTDEESESERGRRKRVKCRSLKSLL